MGEQHARELKQARELWAKEERVRRDKCLQEREKKIREDTVRALEPRLQQLMDDNKEKLRVREDVFKEDLVRERERLRDEHHRHLVCT